MAETLGSLLRAKREALGLTLEEVEAQTKLRARHLQAIESDDLTTIPSVAQARGFIRSYSAFLGVNDEEISERIGVTRPRPRIAPSAPTRPITRPRLVAAPSLKRRFFRMDLLLGALVTLITVSLLLWGGYNLIQNFSPSSGESTTAPLLSIASETVTGVATAEGGAVTGTPPAADVTPVESETGAVTVVVPTVMSTAIPTPLGGVYTDVRIHLMILQRAYLIVDVDGKTVFSRRVLPGETCNPNSSCDFIGRRSVVVSTGNAAGIQLIFNGIDLGPLGTFGQMVSRSFAPAGEVVPTATPMLVPTITPTITQTPKP